MTQWIALLRGINVGGHKKVPMAELRNLCENLGWQQVQTYIQSGNVVFQSLSDAATLEQELEREILSHFGFDVCLMIRLADQWKAICAGNPFPAASENEPSRVGLGLAKEPITESIAEAILSRAKNSERVKQIGDALWIHYPEGAGQSKITPALLDRLAGSPVTMRNWRTAVKLQQMITLDTPR